jgi:hypothetical protein
MRVEKTIFDLINSLIHLDRTIYRCDCYRRKAISYRATMVNLRSAVYSRPNISWALM